MQPFASKTSTLVLLTMCVAIIDRDGAQGQPANGKLTVTVISGDLENSPADDAEVYVHGHPFRAHLSNTDVEAVVKQVRSGRYEFSLAPGLYDVFVRESGSYPRCKRVQIDAGGQEFWLLKLEIDAEHLAR